MKVLSENGLLFTRKSVVMMLFHVLFNYRGSFVDCRAQPFKNGLVLMGFQISFSEGKAVYTDRFFWEKNTWNSIYEMGVPGSIFKRIPQEVAQQILTYLNEKFTPDS